jgi:monovalent cation:H+ antiporter-2, CPA2 family
MEESIVTKLVLDLLVILLAGLAAGTLCKRFGLSVLVGYLVVGALLGRGGLIVSETPRLKYLAEIGALFLLFSIGIEFSLGELVRLSRFFFVGGSLQMILVALPVALAGKLLGLNWGPAVLVGAATALSSTILVYKALEEFGETETPHGRRAIAVLLFQDVALVPLMLLVPLLTGAGEEPALGAWTWLALKSLFFVLLVLGLQRVVSRLIIPLLASLRSTELVVLFALTVLGGAGLGAHLIGLPAALGAFAAGLVLADNRLTAQIDALVLPYRETFAAIFFVGLGTLMDFDIMAVHPLVCLGALAGVIALKAAAATVALRAVGLHWRVAGGMGLGLAQLGEFSFLLLGAAHTEDLIQPALFHLMLFLALGSLILTPLLLRSGLRWADAWLDLEMEGPPPAGQAAESVQRAVIVGLGPIGAQVASRMETRGVDVRLVDLSPVNLHPYAQEGFHTVAGDATDPDVLRRSGVDQCSLVVVTVPKDQTARDVVRAVRRRNRTCMILVRCRYRSNIAAMKKDGADAVISEEAEASAGLLRLLESLEQPTAASE